MKNIKREKIFYIALLMNKYNYKINETINRRINNYDFKDNTVITHNNLYIKISTQTHIKGIYNVLFLFCDGDSKLDFEFD